MINQNSLLAALPAANVRRFTPKRKAAIVDAVTFGAISKEDVCARYEITPAEFHQWGAYMAQVGVQALRTTRLQEYRQRCA